MSWDAQRAFATTLARDESVTAATITPETTDAFFKFITCDALADLIGNCLEHKPWLATIEGHGGVVPLDVASPMCRKVIAMKIAFLGRYHIEKRDPLQRSKTCVVRLAVDLASSDLRGVVLKLMRNREEFEAELLNRRGTRGVGCVIGVQGTSWVGREFVTVLVLICIIYPPACKGFHVLAEIEQIVGGLEETKGDKEGGSDESPPSLDLSGDPELLDLQRPEKRAPGDSMDSEYPYVLVLVSCVS